MRFGADCFPLTAIRVHGVFSLKVQKIKTENCEEYVRLSE